MSFLKTTMIGNIGKDAEVKEFSGSQWLSFSVAISNGKDEQGNYRPSTWCECVYKFNPQTQDWLKRSLVKGSLVYVEGRPRVTAYVNKNQEAVPVFEVFASSVEVMQPRQNQQQSGNQPQQGGYQAQQPYQQNMYQQPQAQPYTGPVMKGGDDNLPF